MTLLTTPAAAMPIPIGLGYYDRKYQGLAPARIGFNGLALDSVKRLDKENPPSELTVMLHDAGWSWNQDWTWKDPKTGKAHHISDAVRLAERQRITQP